MAVSWNRGMLSLPSQPKYLYLVFSQWKYIFDFSAFWNLWAATCFRPIIEHCFHIIFLTKFFEQRQCSHQSSWLHVSSKPVRWGMLSLDRIWPSCQVAGNVKWIKSLVKAYPGLLPTFKVESFSILINGFSR